MNAIEVALLCCALAASGGLAARVGHVRTPALMLLACAATFAAGVWLMPSPAFAGCWMAACAAWVLWRHDEAFAQISAGSCAALAALALVATGLPCWLSLVTLIVPLASRHLAFARPRFAPVRMTEEALCGIVIASLVLAAAPAVEGGWQNAAALNRDADALAAPMVGASWVWYAAAAGFAAGILGGWLRRR